MILSDDMKTKIQELILANPRKYTVMLKKRPELMEWIYANSDETDDFITRLYCALNSVSSVCPNGSRKRVKHFNEGMIGCGPAKGCECTKLAISASVSDTMSNKSEEAVLAANAKRETTMVERYGYATNGQRPELKETRNRDRIPTESLGRLMDTDWLTTEYVVNDRSASDIANELKVYSDVVLEYCLVHGIPINKAVRAGDITHDIAEFVRSMGVDVEIDASGILIPSKSIVITTSELANDSYHPADKAYDDRKIRLNRSIDAESRGIGMLFITDHEWHNQRSIVESMIRSKVGITKKIHARKCTASVIDTVTARDFFNANHLQGHINATYYNGLFYSGELVMAISVGRSRFSGDGLELYRLAASLDTTVVGGGSKLLKFLSTLDNSELVSYCDRSKSFGNGYRSMGFEYIGTTEPGYFWTNGVDIISRYKTRKNSLKKWMPSYDESLSESENMFRESFRRYWDCGNYIFKLTNSTL
jgi:hypothetical protein